MFRRCAERSRESLDAMKQHALAADFDICYRHALEADPFSKIVLS
jgi:hypothetical protein